MMMDDRVTASASEGAIPEQRLKENK